MYLYFHMVHKNSYVQRQTAEEAEINLSLRLKFISQYRYLWNVDVLPQTCLSAYRFSWFKNKTCTATSIDFRFIREARFFVWLICFLTYRVLNFPGSCWSHLTSPRLVCTRFWCPRVFKCFVLVFWYNKTNSDYCRPSTLKKFPLSW